MQAIALRLKEILGLATEPVAVFFLPQRPGCSPFDGFLNVTGHRYCQLIMRARHGESLRLDPGGLACPAAAAAFGFKPLPEGLATGKGVVGFGVVSEPEPGKAMSDGMTHLPPGSLAGIAVCPLAAVPAAHDVVVVEGPPEQLMWLALADLNLAGGKRQRGDTAVLQATYVDATIIPHVEQRLNFSFGCYGCREATAPVSSAAIVSGPSRRRFRRKFVRRASKAGNRVADEQIVVGTLLYEVRRPKPKFDAPTGESETSCAAASPSSSPVTSG